ncbi:hypothetical protein EZV73_08090 [Acidaminobacter sp. JC074]|uniref:hypothetical protein n=1 Tax=Acidaminobacter sp. JC074 TaxID=2530199 RepID=UPI001F0EA6F7|nr:hypothetical protein [Acidaminobacter sp. JC074]MCH4887528.1 hypothetical protein [Acidaminobacter sp. JC074]
MINIKIYTATVITCAKYALEVLHNDLSGLAGGGCGGSGGGCGCSGGASSLMTIEDLEEIFSDMDGYEIEVINHDEQPERYYEGLKKTFDKMGFETVVDNGTVEYIKSAYAPIITVDDIIISMGRVPEDYELIDAIEENTKVPVAASAGF